MLTKQTSAALVLATGWHGQENKSSAFSPPT